MQRPLICFTLTMLLNRLVVETPKLIKAELMNLRLNITNRSIKILDIGGGRGLVWMDIDQSGWLAANDIQLEVTILDSSETVEKYASKNLGIHWQEGVAPGCLESEPSGSVDFVTALDVIEHLPKHEGYQLLYQIHRISSHSFLRTPNGFVWQPPFSSNPFQAHVSSWTPRELRKMGWRNQYGEAGPKFLIGIGARPRYLLSLNPVRNALSFFERALIFIFRLTLFRIPSWSFEFVAIRRVRNFDLESYAISKN